MSRIRLPTICATGLFLITPPAVRAQQWVTFEDNTASRLNAPAVATNADEKAFAWGDVDGDQDTDLVIARKQPFTTPGKRTNVLLLNENGVLVDRTAAFATASDVPGDLGFLTPTNDRDVILADVNNDGWLDIVTAPTISTGDPKHIGHPRIYRNLGCGGTCSHTQGWLGFRYEDQRIPALLSWSDQVGFNPCLCSVSAGDVNGDSYVDLWLMDYTTGCAAADFNSRLLINKGSSQPGFFVDETHLRLPAEFPVTNFGVAGVVADFTNDGSRDVMNQENTRVTIARNASPSGFFEEFDFIYGGSAYFASAAELNNDGKLDLIVTDDGADRYLLNMGVSESGTLDFTSFTFSFSTQGTGPPSADFGFGGNNVAADLDGDALNDVLITDVDVDIPGCGRRMQIYHNLGGPPGGPVTLREQTTGTGCAIFQNNPPTCLVAGIPADKLKGVHDVAVLDINGDDQLDLVVGRCTSTEVYLNQQACSPDCDGDGVAAALDNCDETANPNQQDQDGDGWGDACDGCPLAVGNGEIDSDADGFGDDCDNCDMAPNFSEGVAGFSTIHAVNQDGFCWEGILDLWWVRGDLSGVASYAFTNLSSSAGSSCFADSLTPSPGAGFWYLARANCPGASWQSALGAEPGRDLVLP